ncbi:CdaR family protein [Desulforamulus aquiferis]|uniref:CdaR family protein n=1 Tax=Desulforamulus aquiferis TaxID=1397668 RepID=A0AAW7ZBT4_9FIRM|nr:CdaR family protein [Desulforamulus aquiferis]MDO7786561.1 CdaR family protein [Desulforamulus aquiferis]
MIRLKWSNNSMMLLSVLLAILLWIYVTNVQNPVKEQEFRVNLDVRGEVPQGLTMAGMPKTVTVRVQGKNAQLTGIQAADFQAIVELGPLEEGETTRTVQITAPSGLQVVQVNPARVNLELESIIQKQVPVTVAIRGEPVTGYYALEPAIQPTAVLIRGPARIINEIKSLEVTANISGASQNVDQTLMVPLPEGVTSSPDRVKVLVPVTQAQPYKVLPVVVKTTGTLPEQYQLVRAIPQPATVQVYAPVEVLNNLENITTENIRLDGITDNVLKEARLLLPEGVIDMIPGRVEVSIQVRPKQPQATDPPPTTPPTTQQPPPATEPVTQDQQN